MSQYVSKEADIAAREIMEMLYQAKKKQQEVGGYLYYDTKIPIQNAINLSVEAFKKSIEDPY